MKTILIAESDKRDLKRYRNILLKHDYRVLVASDAEECLTFYRSELEKKAAAMARKRETRPASNSFSVNPPFDAVILNYSASASDGLRAARQILSVNPQQRIVFITDADESAEELQKEFYGRLDIIQKPLAPEDLVEILESTKVYRALEKLGLDIPEVKEYNLYHFQLLELLAARLALLETRQESEK